MATSEEPDYAGEWVRITDAAQMLGTSNTQIYRYIHRGDLHPRNQHPRLRLDELQTLHQARREPKPTPPAPPPHEPDVDHDWLTCAEAAAMLGVSTVAVAKRARAGRISATWHRGRWWFRADHLDLFRRARQFRTKPMP